MSVIDEPAPSCRRSSRGSLQRVEIDRSVAPAGASDYARAMFHRLTPVASGVSPPFGGCNSTLSEATRHAVEMKPTQRPDSTKRKMLRRRSRGELVTPDIDRSPFTSTGNSQQLRQAVVVRIRVAGVLAEGFAVFTPISLPRAADQRSPFCMYSSMPCCLRSQLRWLSWQASIFCFVSNVARHVDDEVGLHRAAERVGPFDRVDVIEVRDAAERRGRRPLAGRVVGDRGGEAGFADEHARQLVVGHVVDGRSRQHDVGPGSAEALADFAAARRCRQ